MRDEWEQSLRKFSDHQSSSYFYVYYPPVLSKEIWIIHFKCYKWTYIKKQEGTNRHSKQNLCLPKGKEQGRDKLGVWDWYIYCASSSPVFLMMYSACKWNKQVTIYSLDVLLSLLGTSLLFQVRFCHFLNCIQVSQNQ